MAGCCEVIDRGWRLSSRHARCGVVEGESEARSRSAIRVIAGGWLDAGDQLSP